MKRVARRRAFFGGIVAGGVAAPLTLAPAEAAAATWTPRAVRVDALRAGDVVVGPEGASRRLTDVRRLANRSYRLLVTDDSTGRDVPLNDRWATTGAPGSLTLLVLARGVAVRQIRFGERRRLDGGDAATTAQLRRGTHAQWAQVDPVLAAGEPAFEVDTMRLKIGDGGARWSDLPYVAGSGADGPRPGSTSSVTTWPSPGPRTTGRSTG